MYLVLCVLVNELVVYVYLYPECIYVGGYMCMYVCVMHACMYVCMHCFSAGL